MVGKSSDAAWQSSHPDITPILAPSGPVPSGLLVDPAPPKHTTSTAQRPHTSGTPTGSSSSHSLQVTPSATSLVSSSTTIPVAASSHAALSSPSTASPGIGMAKLTMTIVIPVVVLVIITPILLIYIIMRRRRRRHNQLWSPPNEKSFLSSRDQSPKRPPKRGDPFRTKPWEKPAGTRRQQMIFSGFDFDFPTTAGGGGGVVPPKSVRSSISTHSPRCVTPKDGNRKRGGSDESTSMMMQQQQQQQQRTTPPPPFPPPPAKSKHRFRLPSDLSRHPLPDLPREARSTAEPAIPRTRQSSFAQSVRTIFTPSSSHHPSRGLTRSSSLIPSPLPPPPPNRESKPQPQQTNQQGTNAWLRSYPYPLSRSLTVRSLSLEDIQSSPSSSSSPISLPNSPSPDQRHQSSHLHPDSRHHRPRRENSSASSPVLSDISGLSFDPSVWVGLYDRTAPGSPVTPGSAGGTGKGTFRTRQWV